MALSDGDEPSGSPPVDSAGRTLFEGRNRVKGGDATRPAEFASAQLPITTVAPGTVVDGPANGYADTMKFLNEATFR